MHPTPSTALFYQMWLVKAKTEITLKLLWHTIKLSTDLHVANYTAQNKHKNNSSNFWQKVYKTKSKTGSKSQ